MHIYYNMKGGVIVLISRVCVLYNCRTKMVGGVFISRDTAP